MQCGIMLKIIKRRSIMTKRIINLLTVLVFTVSLEGVLPAVTASAGGGPGNGNEYIEVDDFMCIVSKNDIVSIVGYSGTETSIKIPDTINGKAVTSIDDYAFSYRENLTSITIPDSITCIGYEAFYDCENLTSVTIPKNVTEIGDYAFGFYLNLYWDNDSDSEIEEIVKFNNFKIYCYDGTAGEQYAKNNGFNYELLDNSNTPNNPNNNSTKPNQTVSPINKEKTPSTTKVSVAKPAKVKSVKLTAKKKKLNVKWKKVSGATGYEVMYAKNNKFTKGKKTVKVKKNKITLKRLKSKKKYFVKVRAYKTVNGNTSYGKWSKVAKKKVK